MEHIKISKKKAMSKWTTFSHSGVVVGYLAQKYCHFYRQACQKVDCHFYRNNWATCKVSSFFKAWGGTTILPTWNTFVTFKSNNIAVIRTIELDYILYQSLLIRFSVIFKQKLNCFPNLKASNCVVLSTISFSKTHKILYFWLHHDD